MQDREVGTSLQRLALGVQPENPSQYETPRHQGFLDYARAGLLLGVIYAAIVIGVVMIGGCYGAEHLFGTVDPAMKFKANLFTKTISYSDPKNTNAKIEGLKVDPETGEITLQKFEVQANAAEVLAANVDQIKASGVAQEIYLRQAGENLTNATRAIQDAATAVIGVAAPGGITGMARGQVDQFWYFALAAGAGLVLLKWWTETRRR